MKKINTSIKLYANGDWQRPEEFATLRRLVGPAAWDKLDGVAIHTYVSAGDAASEDASYKSIPTAVEKIRKLSGKERIFNSQWFITQKADNYGIKNANHLVFAFEAMAFARIEGAIIWPVTDFVPTLNFVSSDYATPYASGILFGWMSQYYEGEALRTAGDLPAVAAKSEQGVTVLVPSGSPGVRHVRISLAGTGLSRVASAQVLWASEPDDPLKSRIAKVALLPVTMSDDVRGKAVDFILNPATPDRGGGWEIARITLQGEGLKD